MAWNQRTKVLWCIPTARLWRHQKVLKTGDIPDVLILIWLKNFCTHCTRNQQAIRRTHSCSSFETELRFPIHSRNTRAQSSPWPINWWPGLRPIEAKKLMGREAWPLHAHVTAFISEWHPKTKWSLWPFTEDSLLPTFAFNFELSSYSTSLLNTRRFFWQSAFVNKQSSKIGH